MTRILIETGLLDPYNSWRCAYMIPDLCTFNSCCVSSAILPLLGIASLSVSRLLGTCFGGAATQREVRQWLTCAGTARTAEADQWHLCQCLCATSWLLSHDVSMHPPGSVKLVHANALSWSKGVPDILGVPGFERAEKQYSSLTTCWS